jgi:MFS family permease
MSTTTARSVFASRAFSLFFAGQALSYVGDGLRTIAIPLLVYHLTNSASALGVTYALEFLPFAVFGLVGGSLADRIDRRKLMIACDAIRFSIMVLFAIGYATGFLTLGGLYAGIAVMALAAAIFMGGQASSIPYMLGKDRATQAVSALIATEQASVLVTPPLGGALFALAGPLPALLINAFTYLCSQASLALVDDLGPDQPAGAPTLREICADIATGFRFLWRDAAMLQLTVLGGVFNFFGLMTAAVFIPFLKRDLGASDVAVGYALGIGAIGALAGSVIAGRLPRKWPLGRILWIAYALDGVLFIPVVFARNLPTAVVFLALTNACVTFEIAQIVGWRMRIIPEELVGRVFGAVRLVALIGTVPGSIAGGLLADHFGARVPIAISGVGYLVTALAVFPAMLALRRERR